MQEYQIDCEKFCSFITLDDEGIIIKAPPICRKFEGQCISNLTKWVKSHFGYCTIKEINKEIKK
jgi:hypothetical protein